MREPEGKFAPRVFGLLGWDPRPPAVTICDRLKRLREGIGLSQRAMAKRLGINPGTLVRWETGKREPTGERLKKVKALLVGD